MKAKKREKLFEELNRCPRNSPLWWAGGSQMQSEEPQGLCAIPSCVLEGLGL